MTLPEASGWLRSAASRATRSAAARPTLAAALGYLAIVAALFREILFQRRALFERDIHLFWYTQVESFVRIVTTPAWPLWDPYTSFGQPLLADPSAQVLYLPTWLNLLMRPWLYYTLLVVSHLTLSGLGAFRLGRELGLSARAAFASGCLWILSGPFLSLVNVTPHFTGAAWLPWVLLTAERAFQSRRIASALVFGATAAGQILAGSADMCALTWLAAAALLLRHLHWRRWRSSAARAASAVLAGLVALGLSAALWWPAADVVMRSARRALPDDVRQFWSTHPVRLVEAVLPIPWQQFALHRELARDAYEGREPFLHSVYLGLPTLALFLAALRHRRRGFVALLLFFLCGVLLVALGRYTPVHSWLVTLFPPAGVLRYPQKALVLFAAGWALLAGFGFDAWAAGDAARVAWRLRVASPLAVATAALGIALGLVLAGIVPAERLLAGTVLPASEHARALAMLVGRLWPSAVVLGLVTALAFLATLPGWARATACLVAALAAGSLFWTHRQLNPTAHVSLFRSRPAVLDALPQEHHSRLYVYDYLRVVGRSERYLGHKGPYAWSRAPMGWTPAEASALAMQDALLPPIAGAWGRESSYEVDFRGLYSKELAALTLALAATEGTPAHSRLLRLGAVGHVVALHQAGFEDFEPVAIVRDIIADPIRVFRVPDALPRAYAVSGARIADGPRALALMLEPSFSPRSEIVLPAGTALTPDQRFVAQCDIVEARPDRIRLSTQLSTAGFVVLVDAFDPGWHATVDGRSTPVLRANLAFRAVPVPPGRHDVLLVYRPPHLVSGLIVSVTTLLVVAALLLARSRGDVPAASRPLGPSGQSRAIDALPEAGRP